MLFRSGQGKGQDFTPIKDALHKRVKAVVLMGEDASLLAKSIPESVTISYAEDMDEAVKLAVSHAHQGDVVLLSPACASFDMFKNYEQRGDVYMSTVREVCV